MRYKIKKVPLMFYYDYVIQNGKLYIFQETQDDRVHTNFICKTTKKKCDDLKNDDNFIYITINMKTYNFNVTQTDIYSKSFSIQANDYPEAVSILEEKLENIPLSQLSNTLEESFNDLDPIPNIHSSEELFNIDNNETFDVILVDELSDAQKNFLNLNE